jgi:hypothetical protein
MKRKWLVVGISIIAVVLLVLGSLSNVVGYQSVQTSQQNIINERINQRELLFQTIVDITNNKEIQRIILKSQMSRGIFPASEFPVVTKTQIKMMYFLGLILSKVISKSRMQAIVKQHQIINPEIHKEISTAIEKNPTIIGEITQLQNFECECENTTAGYWQFPVLCTLLFPIWYVSFISLLLLDELSYVFNFRNHPICLSVFLLIFFVFAITNIISTLLNCFFIYIP